MLFRSDLRWEEKGTTEDEMVGWHHRLDGHEFEQAPGVGDGQRSLVCCSPWDRKESTCPLGPIFRYCTFSPISFRPFQFTPSGAAGHSLEAREGDLLLGEDAVPRAGAALAEHPASRWRSVEARF